MNFALALRQRFRDWRTSLAFITVIGIAVTVAGTWMAVALPLLRRALPFPAPEQLVAIQTLRQSGERAGLSWMDVEDLRSGSVESIAGFLPRTWGLQTEDHGHVEVVLSQQVTGDFFKALGVEVALGQPLIREHERTGNQDWIWFSRAAWQLYLGGQTDFAKRVVWLNAVPYRVAGVLPASFNFPHQGESPDIYIPLNHKDYWNSRGGGGLSAIARLRSGVSIEEFRSELRFRGGALESQFPATNRNLQFGTSRISDFLLGDRLILLRWLMIAVLLLLLIAMANAGGIWLAQWLRQQRRIAIQLSLGATRSRIVMEQCAQVLVLGGTASLLGLGGVAAMLSALRASSLFDPELARFELWQKADLEWTSASLLVLITLATSLIAGVLPMLTVRGNAGCQLRTGGHTATNRSSTRLRVALAVAQLTITGALAYSGILIGTNVHDLLRAGRGFQTDQILVSGIGISEAKYNTDEKMIGFHQRAIAELKRIPGVMDAAGGVSMPVSRGRTRFLVDDETAPRERQRMSAISVASAGLLPLLQIPCVRGRLFAEGDRWNTAKVALVNQAFAERYLGGDPFQHRLRFSFYNGFATRPYEPYQIVGVIGNTLNRDLAMETEPQIVISADQMAFEGFQYFLRSSLPASALRREVQEAVWRVDPEVQRVGVRPLVEQVEKSLVSRRLLVWLLDVFGGIAILVVVFGLASTLSATFLEMTRDLAIRSALGAPQLSLAYESVRWAVGAIVLSEVLIAPISIVLGRLLVLDRGAVGWSGASWVAASAVLAGIGVVTALVPARKAAVVDTASVLRCE
jgi:putative ABC transport system permease protein